MTSQSLDNPLTIALVLQICIDKNMVLKREKCQFIVIYDILLGYKFRWIGG